MRSTLYAGLCCAFLSAMAYPQTSAGVGSEPSPMEAFANRPEVRTTWSSEIARLERDGTRLVITALVLEDNARPSRTVRGVRIDLTGGAAGEQIYLDGEAAERTRAALEEIAGAVARSGIPGGNGCMGAKEFWPLYDWPWNKYHELNADFCGGPNAPALVLYARGKGLRFRFPGETPARLAEILAGARDELQRH